MAPRPRPLTVLVVVLLALFLYYGRIRHEMIDFLTWREAAVRALDAAPLYRPEDGHYQFKYFPLFALVMAPFGILDPEAGKVLWFGITVALLAALLRWSITALPERRLSRGTLLFFAILFMAKFYAHELLLGQVNLLLGALLLAALLAVQRQRSIAAGGLLGAAVFVKPYAVILVPWLYAVRGSRAAATALGTVAIGLLLPAVVYGWTGNLDLLRAWLRTVSDSTAPNLLGSDNVSIVAMWAKWIGIGPLASSLTGLTMAAIGILIIVAFRLRFRVPNPDYLECALLMLLIPLISPQGWDYVLLLATPGVVCLVDRWRELNKPMQWVIGVALPLMGLTMFDLMGRTLYGTFMSLSLVTVCALALAGGLAHVRWRLLA